MQVELELGGRRCVSIGVIHLPNLRRIAFEKGVDELEEFVEREAATLRDAGFDAIMVENFMDKPYRKRVAEPEILGLMALAIRRAKKVFGGPVGVSLLRCSAVEAYRLAWALGGSFIRVNASVETIATDSGLIEPALADLAEIRQLMPGIKVLGDVVCKHSGSLDLALRYVVKLLEREVTGRGEPLLDALREILADAIERGELDAVIVTGGRTGEAPPIELVKFFRNAVRSRPLVLGSGANPENVCRYLEMCDAIIVGSYIKIGGRAGNPTDPERARKFVESVKRCSSLGR